MLEILQKEIKEKGIEQLVKELGISKTTVYLVLHGKYKVSTAKIEEKIKNQCADIYAKSEFVGKYVSNPEK